MRASKVMARGATNAEARLIHYELAGCYSVKAVRSEIPKLDVIDTPPVEAYASCDAESLGSLKASLA